VRMAAMGRERGAPSDRQMAEMKSLVQEGLDAGAVGLSTGLIYEPGRHARTDEIVELAALMRGTGALYATHMRDEGAGLLASIDEAIAISNSTAYGLSSAVCTNRLDYITRFISELNVGTVNVREVPGYRLELTPFGGIKDSGLGYKEGVQEAMKSFTNTKTYSLPW